ncbi:Ig-like domain-containing protein [Blastopirellula sp. J2-11]|uniref:Ig-like domain-containing protein n=1 Tax=Blastopirellula sp. J2-11 TaxID=2943192 RepID=UPI0021C9F35E|nr:Ig-like domain-containing protein [Blastopirellula sp. J2-11]UUO07762.1 Ig-like domain-containing protein [Blastopirellula sp. J2-11]
MSSSINRGKQRKTNSNNKLRKRRKRQAMQAEHLEARQLLAMDVYVDDNWALLSPGDDPDGPATNFGVDSFATIQEAVNKVDAGGTVTVGDGAYTENILLNKELTLVSVTGRDNTTIEGISGVGALATVWITSDNVTLGESGKGFTIVGIDNGSPGLENAAVYIDNDNSGTTIEGNHILANGDSAILTEYNFAVTNLVINDNIIGGTTFVVPPMSGPQFTTDNVPRGLVYINGGSTNDNTGMTANITFTGNTIEGTSGGVDAMMMEVGQSLVTINSDGATITGNEFKGTTFGTAATLRAGGKNAEIHDNKFDVSLQGESTSVVSLLNTSTGKLSNDPETLGDILNNNEFTQPVFANGAKIVEVDSIQDLIDLSTAGDVLRFSGEFTEDVVVDKAITLGGDFKLNGKLDVTAPGAILSAGFSPGIIASGDLTLMSGTMLDVEFNGIATAGVDFDQYQVTGTVDLGGSTLVLSGSAMGLSHLDQITFIDNDGTDAVTGTFDGLANGALINFNSQDFRIFYNGGDGNDVVLIRDNVASSDVLVDDDFSTAFAGEDLGGGYFYLINAFSTIQEGVDDVTVGGTVTVNDGTYVENVTINKDLTLQSLNGRDDTTIEGLEVGGALGTLFIQSPTTAVTIDGFTIIGIDGTTGLEKAAVYFQGSHSGAKILNNDIVANGDGGLITEYSATINDFLIDNNIFSGQTFDDPAVIGGPFDPNGAQQLVVMGGGNDGGSTSNITFSNNQIIGTAGDIAANAGNTLVTIDANIVFITDNTFAGTTARYGSSLRARGNMTTITGNTFDLSMQGESTNALFLYNNIANKLSTDPATFEDIFLDNDFGDNAYFVNGQIDVGTMQDAIDAAAPGDVIYFIGDYTEAAVDISQAITVAGEFDLTGTLTASAPGAILSAGFSPGIIASGDLTLMSGTMLDVEFNGIATAGTDFDQYQVTGTVDLGGSTLVLSGSAMGLSHLDQITFIDNDGTDAVTGTFDGLANGALINFNSQDFRIFYNGGDGNDVVLIRDNVASSDVLVDDDFSTAFAGEDLGGGYFYLINAFSTIQEGVDDVTVGGTVTVNDGTYVENVLLYKELTLVSDTGRDNTIIEGISNAMPLALATVWITSDNVTLGESGKGFTIVGIDNGSPGLENAAVYIDNDNSGTTIEGNHILANGDSAILTEYNFAVTNLVINDNIIGGTTFVVPPMSGPQFTTDNVPRGLVYINGGSTNDNTGMTANITFTGNTIEGTSGGVDAMMMEVGQSLVTIDSDGAVITDNEFKGTTFGTATTLQVRGKDAEIHDNTFDITDQGEFTNIVSLLNTSTGELSIAPLTLFDLVTSNTFLPGMPTAKTYFEFIPGMTPSGDRMVVRTLEQNGGTLQGAVNAAKDGSTLYFLDLYGDYNEDLDINKPVTVSGEFTLLGELKASAMDATLNAGFSPGTIVSGDMVLTAGSKLTVEIEDVITAGVDFDQYVVNGTVNLGGATLDIIETLPITSQALGYEFILIDNDGSLDPVVGTFAGINNGDVVTIGGEDYLLFYDGGNGNDVVLVRDSDMTPIVYVDDDWAMGVPSGDEVIPGYFLGVNAFATIQEGVDDVDTDGEVRVLEGSYDESVFITRGVTVQGQGMMSPAEVMVTAAAGNGFLIDTAGDVILQNMQIQSSDSNGVQVDNGGNITLENLILNDSSGSGFGVSNSLTLSIFDVEYTGNGSDSKIKSVGTFNYETTTGEEDIIDINSKSIGGTDNFQHNRGGDYQDIIHFTDLDEMFVSTFDGLDRFTIAPHLTTVINIDGGNPVFGDPDVPPGDVLALFFGGVTNPVVGPTPDGSVTSGSHADINYVSIETIIVPDQYEINNTIAQATILGSPESVILNNLSIHDDSDVDFFRYTAHFTGKLYVNALFTNVPEGDLQLEVYDQSGDLIAKVDTHDDNENLVISVVSQQKYYIRVAGSDDGVNPVDDVNQYSLEIENFAAPAPHGILISPLSDTGSSPLDNVTTSKTPLIYIQDDLLQFVDENGNNMVDPPTGAPNPTLGELPILTADQANLGATAGFAVEISITLLTGVNAGAVIRRFADVVGSPETATVFVYNPETYGDELEDGEYLISARTVVFDGQTPVARANTSLATSVRLTVDAAKPGGSNPDLVSTADSGALAGDNVTNVKEPIFQGTGEANAKVFLYANNNTTPIGQGSVDSQGKWAVQTSSLTDGVYTIRVAYEDLAGNRSALSQGLDIEIDTQAPNTPYLDLDSASDTGRNDEDNVTMAELLTFHMTTSDTSQPPHIFDANLQYRLYLRAEGGEEILVYDSSSVFTSIDPLVDGFTDQNFVSKVDLSVLTEGYHDFKLEVEDRAGNISTDYLLDVVIDRTKPDAPTLEIDPSSTDTGVTGDPNTLADKITSDSNTGFVGDAESNSVIRLYAGDTPIDPAMLAALNGMSSADVIAYLNSNYVYQGLTAASPLDGNDGNPEVGYWGLNGKYDLNNPNYFSYDGIRQIVVTSEDLAGNISSVTTLEMMIDTQGPQIENVSVTGSPDYDLFAPKPAVDGPTPPITSLEIDFSDLPVRPGVELFAPGNSPNVVFVIDASSSTNGAIAGSQVGDLNGDGIFNSILDAEIAAVIQANQQLIDAGLGNVAKVSLVVMVSGSVHMFEMNTNSDFTTAAADNNNNGELDLIEALKSINAGGSAEFTAGLEAAKTALENSGFANSTVLFFADGFSGTPGDHAAAAAELHGVAKNVYAIGVGMSDLAELQIIDPDAVVYTTTNDLLNTSVIAPVAVDNYGFLYPAISDATALQPGAFQLIGDANGLVPIKSITINHDTTPGSIGRSTVTLEFFEALPDDRYTLKIADSLTDPAGNQLDGESNAAESQDAPSFATGNGVAGGAFSARFTIDTHPEIGVASYGTTLIDINGNWYVDTQNADDTNEDLTFAIGFTTDDVFAGQFTPSAGSVADGFDRLAVYGMVHGKFRFQFDFDNDGAPDATVVQNLQINGTPIAGNFDGNAANGDEVGVYVGETGTFWIDTNHDNQIDTPIVTSLVGKPIVGDWDGDGFDDLGVWRDDTFFLDLTNGVDKGWNGSADQIFSFGFEGVRERPVSADFNSDGVEDLGLWVPDQNNSAGSEAEWFLLISDSDANGVARPIWENPARMIPPSQDPLGRNVAKFLTDPFGPDQHAVFGNSKGLPVVGNFDPPVADELPQNPTPTIEFPEINVPSPNSHFSTWEEAADLDHDGVVTLLDLALVIRHIGAHVGSASDFGWAYDLDHDGVISLLDLSKVIRKIGNRDNSAPNGAGNNASLESEAVDQTSAPPAATTSHFEIASPVSEEAPESMISSNVVLEGEDSSSLIWIPSDVTSTTTAPIQSATYQAVNADVASFAQVDVEVDLVDALLLDSLNGESDIVEHFDAVDRLFTEEEGELEELLVF